MKAEENPPLFVRLIFNVFELFPVRFLLLMLLIAKPLARDDIIKKRISNLMARLKEESSPQRMFLNKFFSSADYKVREKLYFNLIYRSNYRVFLNRYYGQSTNWLKKYIVDTLLCGLYSDLPDIRKIKQEHGINIPWLILIDPTTSCNLSCKGCWATGYGDRHRLDEKNIDSIVSQAKDLGVYVFIYTGGEPLIEKKSLLSIAEKHDDCTFFSFTNAYYIDLEFVKIIKELGNFFPIISIEGNETETDYRRGVGAYKKAMHGMSLLKKHKVPFGFSVCCHHHNLESVISDEFIKSMDESGAFFGFFFMYVPVGKGSSKDLILSCEQREFMLKNIVQLRKESSMLLLDFWHDAVHVGGCISGGRKYFHINAKGDCEPCAFVHYANENILKTSLLDVMKSPIFMEFKKNQPFNDNHLMACPMTDNPEKLEEILINSDAYSTHYDCIESGSELASKFKESSESWRKRISDAK